MTFYLQFISWAMFFAVEMTAQVESAVNDAAVHKREDDQCSDPVTSASKLEPR